MRYTPATEEELILERLMPEGEYPFEIIEAEEKVSSNGNAMFLINMKVFKQDGSFSFLKDNLMLSGKFRFKLKHCADACGLSHEYESGILEPRHFMRRSGYLKIFIGKAKDGYDPKNEVKDYLKPQEGRSAEPPAAFYDDYARAEPVSEIDDLPFG